MKLRKREIIVIIIGVIIIVLAVALGVVTSIRFTVLRTSVCPVCGARQSETRSLFGGESEPVVEESPFAQWLWQHGRAHVHEWEFLHSKGRNLFGRPISAGSTGNPPPISSVSSSLMEKFLQSASESDIEEFERLMLSGTDIEQQRFIRQRIRTLAAEAR